MVDDTVLQSSTRSKLILLKVVSLGSSRPRFSVEVAYLREDHDFVFILFGVLDC